MMRIAVAVVVCLGCSDGKTNSAKQAEPKSTTTSATPGDTPSVAEGPAQPGVSAPTTGGYGWWRIPDVEAAEDLRGGAMRLRPHDMAIVTKAGRVAVRSCTTSVTGRSKVEVTITGCGRDVTAQLIGDQLQFPQGFSAARVAATEVATLEQLVKQSGDSCERARACYRLAWPSLGRKVDETVDLGASPTADTCLAMLDRAVSDLRDAGKRVPPACAP